MKVLFKSSDYEDLQAVSVENALWQLQSNYCEPAFTAEEREFIAKHANDSLFSLLGESAAQKLAGAYLSDLAAHAIQDADDGGVRGFPCNDVDVQGMVTDEFICGNRDPEKLKEFARELKESAFQDAAFLLKDAGILGETISMEMLKKVPINKMGSANIAFGIMANEPFTTMYAGIYSDMDYGGYMKCWPEEGELEKILEEPELYSVAEVVFK